MRQTFVHTDPALNRDSPVSFSPSVVDSLQNSPEVLRQPY
jgi:hypothetical protein